MSEPVQEFQIEAVAKPGPIAAKAATPMDLLAIAMNQNADLDKLEKLMQLQERWQANEAKQAFVRAMNAFKKNPPEIIKNRSASFGNGGAAYRYADLNDVGTAIVQAASEHGLSHRWKIEQGERIRVTCIITHEMGHSEETSLEAGPDTSGSKNAIQAIASAVSYLEKYTVLGGYGFSAGMPDSDGNTNTPKMEGLEVAIRAIKDSPDTSALATIFKASMASAIKACDPNAQQKLTEAKEKRKKELTATEAA